MSATVETKRRPDMPPLNMAPRQKPRPIGISSYVLSDERYTEVLYDNGDVWRLVDREDRWYRLPPIPQGDA